MVFDKQMIDTGSEGYGCDNPDPKISKKNNIGCLHLRFHLSKFDIVLFHHHSNKNSPFDVGYFDDN